MTEHEKKAAELFRSGCSCSQSVFAAFSDITEIDEKTALKISAPFGAGFARMREVCGAVSGMCLAAGCLFGNSDVSDKNEKAALYGMIHSLITDFKAENGSYICRELLDLKKDDDYSPIPQERTADYYKNRPCEKCVASAARLLDELIYAREKQNF